MGLGGSKPAPASITVEAQKVSAQEPQSTQQPKAAQSNASRDKSLFVGDARGDKIKILFCGTGHFLDGYMMTKEALKAEKNVEVVQCKREDVQKEIASAHVVIPLMCKITKNMIQHAPRLQLIMQYGVGLEGVDVAAATEAGVYVCNIPSATCGNAQSCAEHAIYLALAVLRDQKGMAQSILTGRLGLPTGRTLLNARCIIYGYGGIGSQLSRRLKAFDVHVSVIKKSLTEEEKSGTSLPEHVDAIGTTEDFPALAANADIVFLCMSQNTHNVGMVNKQFLSHLKQNAILINVARGGLLNYDDVLDALERQQLGGVGLDVFHTEPFPRGDPLLLHPKCVATPHVAGVTVISYENMAQLVANNIIRMRQGLEPENQANQPKV